MGYNSNYPTESVEAHVHTSQMLMVTKLLVGKEKEAWEFIRKIFLSSSLGQLYAPLLSSEASAALNSLKAHFGKGTLIDNVRNEFVFHYLSDEWEQRLTDAYKNMEENECVFYVSQKTSNTHWYGAEVAVNYALLETVQGSDPAKAMDKLFDETLDVAGWLTTFVDHCILAIIEKHLGLEFVQKHMEPITISSTPDPKKVNLPFFVQAPNGG